MKIVCIGDSLTSGFGVFKDKRWTELMIKNHKLNIINKGITNSYNINEFLDTYLENCDGNSRERLYQLLME